MAYVILGLLLIAPQSLYDLVKAFEAGVSLVYSASSGSIKRALDGLLAQGRIEVASVDPGSRGRKVYRVTPAGDAAFRDWMLGDLTGPDIETAALSRFFFLGHLHFDERAGVLRRIIARLESAHADFGALGRQIDGADIPDDLRDVATYQRATLVYGIGSLDHALRFFRDRLADLR